MYKFCSKIVPGNSMTLFTKKVYCSLFTNLAESALNKDDVYLLFSFNKTIKNKNLPNVNSFYIYMDSEAPDRTPEPAF